jgi:GNAT superfamily N-acetyltransferase
VIQLQESHDAPVEALMARVLRDGSSIAPEYPLVFRPEFPGRLLGLGEGEDVHSACGFLVRDLVVPSVGSVRCGLIGSVATAPERRSQGLATRLLLAAEERLRAEGCVFSLLWAEDPAFYLERGYGPVGSEYDFVLPHELAPLLPEPSGVRAMTEADFPAVHVLYERHPVRVERSAEETAALLTCPEMTRIVREKGGELVAYACLGRGHDLMDAIHEWGGAADDVLALLRAHLEQRFGAYVAEEAPEEPRHLFLMAPPSATDLYLRLAGMGVPSNRGMLGLGKILDRDAAVRLLDRVLAERGTAELVEDGERCYRVRGPEHEGRLDDEGLVALLFGVSDIRKDVAAFLADFGLEGAPLPIEPFVWGLDSI